MRVRKSQSRQNFADTDASRNIQSGGGAGLERIQAVDKHASRQAGKQAGWQTCRRAYYHLWILKSVTAAAVPFRACVWGCDGVQKIYDSTIIGHNYQNST